MISKDEKVFLIGNFNGPIGKVVDKYNLIHGGFGFSVRKKVERICLSIHLLMSWLLETQILERKISV